MSQQIERLRLSTPFPVGPVNVYLLPGDVPALVDCGLDFKRNRDRLAAAIDRVLDGRVARLLLTHGHIDHMGLAGWVSETYGAEVLVHPADRRVSEDYPGTQRHIGERFEQDYRAAGFPERLYELSKESIRATFDCWFPLAVDGLLEAGDLVRAGQTDWRVSHHPGHSPGLVCFTAPDGLALAGDLLISDLTTIAFFAGTPDRGTGLGIHLDSLRALQALDLRRVGPGHRGWIEDPASELAGQFAAAELRLAQVAALLDRTPISPWELVPAVFDELPDEQGWLALADLLGVLELLEQRGQAVRDTDASGRWRFSEPA